MMFPELVAKYRTTITNRTRTDVAFLSDEIEQTSSELGIKVSRLAPAEARAIRERIAIRFGLDPIELMEQVRPDGLVSICDREIWRSLDDLAGEVPLYLFFRSDDDDGVWRIPDGKSLLSLLRETIGFVFYIASEALDFLAYYDDHDCLLGVGRAADWIRRIKLERRW